MCHHNPTPVLNKTVDGSGTGTFVSDLTGLRPSTTYYVRAYVSAREGTAYGNERIFTTSQAAIPTITTTAISSVTVSSAVTGGTVTSRWRCNCNLQGNLLEYNG